jgi:MFS family permease
MVLNLPAWAFYLVVFSMRLSQGFSTGIMMTLLYSMMVKHLEDASQIFAMNLHTISAGLGVMLGPVIGGYFYREFGYQAPFLIVAVSCFLTCAFVPILVPSKVDFVH